MPCLSEIWRDRDTERATNSTALANLTAQVCFLGRIRAAGRDEAGGALHPAMRRTQARAWALSAMAGNRRRSSVAADSSPS